jgi:hypothetical protein
MPLPADEGKERAAETLSLEELEGLRDEMRLAFEHLRTEFERLEETIMAIQLRQRSEATPEQDARTSRLGYIRWARRSRIRPRPEVR